MFILRQIWSSRLYIKAMYELTCCTTYIIQNCQRGTGSIFLPAMAKWSASMCLVCLSILWCSSMDLCYSGKSCFTTAPGQTRGGRY